MKGILVGSLLVATSLFGIAPIVLAENWTSVTVSEFDGKTYLIDLDSRSQYTSETGWKHVIFRIYTDQETYSHKAVAACEPYQVSVPDYGWNWPTDKNSYSVYTVGGKLARAACNW
jgi:hypothetical protein